MSIRVENITKKYGTQLAVNAVSFEIKKGEIVGFLGPNGAGKTTTIKMLTSYLSPSSGEAIICGFNTQTDEAEVKKRIGYLPEHNPLYKDMYIKEYLAFVAGLYKIPNIEARVNEIVELTGLTKEKHKKISQISKGYRQRVGLAQAIIHNPEVLILDEPTSGLDPNQLIEIRQLIKKVGENKTVLFSSHIMQEVEAICDRVIIINEGKLIADDSIDHIKATTNIGQSIHMEFDKAINIDQWKKLAYVKSIIKIDHSKYNFIVSDKEDARPAIFNHAVKNNLIILEMKKTNNSVESVFQQLTAKKA